MIDDAFSSYSLNPIILVNGIASGIVGQMLPITDIVGEGFAIFDVLPGGVVIDNDLGRYSFANQSVAANAIIVQPNMVSLRMICPLDNGGTLQARQALFTTLVSALNEHSQSGGAFVIATPTYIYRNCILRKLVDITSMGQEKIHQTVWELTFEQPLVTESDAQQALNAMMTKISAGLPIEGEPTWSGPQATTNTAPTSATANTTPVTGTAVGGLANPVNIKGPQ